MISIILFQNNTLKIKAMEINKLATVILLTLSVNICIGQAWTKPKGKGFYKLDYSTIRSEKVFNDDGVIVDAPKLSNSAISLYGEHGISDRITLQAYVPLVINNVDALSGTSTNSISKSGLGDIDIALSYALKTSGVAVSLSALLGLPTGYNEGDALVTGDGEFNQMIKLNAGSGAEKWWTQAGLGFNNRTNNYSDEIRYNAEFGYKFVPSKFYAILKIGGISTLRNGTRAPNTLGLYSNDVSYFAPAIELMYYIKPNLGLTLRGAGAGSGATNVQASPQVGFSLFADIK